VPDRYPIDLSPAEGYEKYVPNPRFLLLHASVAKVLNASGRGEKADEFWREYRDRQELAVDGSSFEILAAALSMLVDTEAFDNR
jgi:hypothetical protein